MCYNNRTIHENGQFALLPCPLIFIFIFHSDGEYIVRVPNVDANHHLEIIDAMGLSNNNKEVLLWVWFGEKKENLYRCIISVE